VGTVPEHGGLEHRVLVPPGRRGRVKTLFAGARTVEEPVLELEDGTTIALLQRWPVRRPRPVRARLDASRPLLTGQRIFDFFFPVAEGGTVAVPGGFGTGKTVIEQSLAKYADADVVVYVGCGERGNEMAEVLHDFAALKDPRTGRSVLERTVLVVNTSNMPVAARESSVYLGLTVAEFFRDQGYRVAVMADSLSRWAEALREIGSRLQEMPGEEGYPTYLASRAARLHERAGRVTCLGRPERQGSVTLISAVSPPGGDFSEPVTQACLRVAGALWALDPELAHQRQFPAVDWQVSYSLYAEAMGRAFEQLEPGWVELRSKLFELLQRDTELRDIASVVGPEALEDKDRLLLAAAAIAREVLLGQSAFDPNDAYSTTKKTFQLAKLSVQVLEAGQAALERGKTFAELELPPLRRALAMLRDAPEAEREARASTVLQSLHSLSSGGGEGRGEEANRSHAASGAQPLTPTVLPPPVVAPRGFDPSGGEGEKGGAS
jgi:V/A-type H+-transporting ATPase subunit A